MSDTAGLTFVERLSQTSPVAQTGTNATLWEFYAFSPSPLSSDNVSVNLPQNQDVAGLQVIAIRGADPGTSFDTDPSVPAAVPCPSPDCGGCYANGFGSCSASVQTTSIDFIIATTVINDAGTCGVYNNSPPPGFTNIVSENGRFELDYMITTTPRTSVEFDCNGTDTVTIGLDAVAVYDPNAYSLQFQGYDWDGAREENITLNGIVVASLPSTDTPADAGVWASFSLSLREMVVQGTNTLTFTHANWDCTVSDNVQNLQISSGSSASYSNSTLQPLSCNQPLTYSFTV